MKDYHNEESVASLIYLVDCMRYQHIVNPCEEIFRKGKKCQCKSSIFYVLSNPRLLLFPYLFFSSGNIGHAVLSNINLYGNKMRERVKIIV